MFVAADPVMSLGDSVDDPDLKLLDEESEAWSGSVDRKVSAGSRSDQVRSALRPDDDATMSGSRISARSR